MNHRVDRPAFDAWRALIVGHRTREGLSLQAAARACKLDHALLWRLERGERGPTDVVIARLAAGYGLTGPQRDRLYLIAGFLPPDLREPCACDAPMLDLWRRARRAMGPDRPRDDLQHPST